MPYHTDEHHYIIPCKVGQYLWAILNTKTWKETKIQQVRVGHILITGDDAKHITINCSGRAFRPSSFGKTLFYEYEDAERKLNQK